MSNIHLVSHTHWDREWYLTFQQFRLKLVHLVDRLLKILETDPEYKHFTLDGQTIVLDDYLQLRPEKYEQIRNHVQSGRLIIGPWHILPDEFLVSPEATIRNLLQGDRTARKFGSKMMVGYIPDPFGHIGQMPQILRGFGIQSACVTRGLSDEPCEFWWQSPDGSKVFMAYQRNGYGNAALLPTSSPEQFTSEVLRLRDALKPYAASSQLLFMHGTDHQEPTEDTSGAIAYANAHLSEDILIHSTLPEYISAVQKDLHITGLDRDNLQNTSNSNPPGSIPTITGELRSPKRTPLLPGVLSTRVWIKQRNHFCENLLEKWAEPFSTWASLLSDSIKNQSLIQTQDTNPGVTVPERITNPSPILRQAWRLLMECHPHDSICGCSIDQVHDEMRPRFDQVEQIGEEITHQSLLAIAGSINTLPVIQNPAAQAALIVFNPTNVTRTDIVQVEIELPGEAFSLVDDTGDELPYKTNGGASRELINETVDKSTLTVGMNMIQEGRINGLGIRSVIYQQVGEKLFIKIVLTETGDPDMRAWEKAKAEFQEYLSNPQLKEFVVEGKLQPTTQMTFVAKDIPGNGFRTFWLCSQSLHDQAQAENPTITQNQSDVTNDDPGTNNAIENEFFSVEASLVDGTLTVFDKRNGCTFRGLNRFMDGGDCGDEYNYCPPTEDLLVSKTKVREIKVNKDQIQGLIEIDMDLMVPKSLTLDRNARNSEFVRLPIKTSVTLMPGTPRIDVRTLVDNGYPGHTLVQDHRLRVHFPASFPIISRFYDGHFEIVERPASLPDFDESWVEQPRPEVPQRDFSCIVGENAGLIIASRGLREVGIHHSTVDTTEIALTLLRCVGWLSRDDLATRKGHAGPGLPTPGAQLPGVHTFDYSILPHAGSNNLRNLLPVFYQSYAFNAPLRCVATGLHAGILANSTSLITLESQETESNPRMDQSPSQNGCPFIISSIKWAEDNNGWVVRGYNLADYPLQVNIKTFQPVQRAERVNLAEESLNQLLPNTNGSFNIQVGSKEIASVKMVIPRDEPENAS